MKPVLENRYLLGFIFCIQSQIWAQLCRSPCFCSWITPRCPPGVPLIMDGCGCCRICARQLGESCNHIYLCDETKELLCDYLTSANGRGGTCNYNHDRSCELDGKEYKEGDIFQPSCKFQCKCIDGGVTCIPLCSEDVQLPTPECPSPRRIEIPGKCCQEWICDRQQNTISNHLERGPRVQEASSHIKPLTCPEWSTEWGACSTSCGMGVSLRVSNRNPLCRLETQSRLCMVRPCRNTIGFETSGGSVCTPTVFSLHPIRFDTEDCISVRVFQPVFCGACGSRHCVPYQTTNELVDFNCRGRSMRKLMMFIISCVCY
ncbi:CCN family member 5 [Rhinophrynus dorsalis]